MLLAWNLFGDSLSGVKMLLPSDVTRLINKEDAVVIDIRNESDFEKGHIINAMNIPVAELPNKLAKLKAHKQKDIIVNCANGSVAPKEARKLLNEGFEKVSCLKGGLLAWQNASLPLTKGKG